MAASQRYYDRIAFYTARLAEVDALNGALANMLAEVLDETAGIDPDLRARAKTLLVRCPRELLMQPIGAK